MQNDSPTLMHYSRFGGNRMRQTTSTTTTKPTTTTTTTTTTSTSPTTTEYEQYDFIEELENIALRDDENNEIFDKAEEDEKEPETADEDAPPKEGHVRLVDGRTPYEVTQDILWDLHQMRISGI